MLAGFGRLRVLAAFGILAAVAVPSVRPVPVSADGAPSAADSVGWFVEFGSPPQAHGGSPAFAVERRSFRAAAAQQGLKLHERRDFTHLFNGLAVDVAASDVDELGRLPGVAAVWPIVTMTVPTDDVATDGFEGALTTATAMTGADVARTQLGFTGKGVTVGVIDSGIDYHHPAFGACVHIGPGCRVALGTDFVGDQYGPPGSIPVPDDDPIDTCNGHGTHVAGIIGANGEVIGVAPEVTLAAYKVFGCSSNTTADVLLAAMERALADGVDVVNMSISAPMPWASYPTSVAASRLVQAGVVVVAAAGNTGQFETSYAVSTPANGDKVIAVASYDTNTEVGTGPVIDVNGRAIVVEPFLNSGPIPSDGSHRVVALTDGQSCGTEPIPAGMLNGSYALVSNYLFIPVPFDPALFCGPTQKAAIVVAAGGEGLVVAGSSGGFSVPQSIPVVAVPRWDDYAFIRAQSTPTLTWTGANGPASSVNAGLISNFSSPGPTLDLVPKPDLGAPGGDIRSTLPLTLDASGYGVKSGTSMASPYVAGAAALLLQARPNLPPAAVRDLLTSTADPAPWARNPFLGVLDAVYRQGAGMVDVDGAILTTGRVEPDRIALGDIDDSSHTRVLTVRNDGARAATYNISHQPAIASTGVLAVAQVTLPANVLTVAAHGSANLTVTITQPPDLAPLGLYGGYLVLTPADGGPPLRVAYSGVAGDYQSQILLNPPPQLFPPNPAPPPGGLPVYTLQNIGVPLNVRLTQPTTHIIIDAYTPTGRFMGTITDQQWSRGVYWEWNGLVTKSKRTTPVPDGTYQIVVSVLKPLGNESNPAHWEKWTSPPFIIDRP
jgi:subtilisin family serine protease